MFIEIGYTYTPEKDAEPIRSWTYYKSKSSSFDSKVVKEASNYFKKFCTANGMSRKAKLSSIQPIRHETFITRKPSRSATTRSRRGTQQARSSSSSRSSSSRKKT